MKQRSKSIMLRAVSFMEKYGAKSIQVGSTNFSKNTDGSLKTAKKTKLKCIPQPQRVENVWPQSFEEL